MFNGAKPFKDYTEVDTNVTRHIADELRNDDWNTMILHYLGLDHIGHKSGPRRQVVLSLGMLGLANSFVVRT
jgi:predicted AlkP superfamily pyrophosphatase or phosphodiesterase